MLPNNSPTTRRDLLKSGAVLLASLAVPKAIAATGRRKKVIVAGGGIGGLCCAFELMERGHDVTLLEASRRTGGHVKTMREPLPDGLYADVGAEQFTKPGYTLYWKYVDKFGLTALPWPRRRNMYRRIDGQWYTEEQLADPVILRRFGFNEREIDHLVRLGWGELRSLYLAPYAAKIKDEYQPFGVGLDHLDQVLYGDLLAQDGASEAARRFAGASRRSSPSSPPTAADVSALFRAWHLAILQHRGLSYFLRDLYHLKGGNDLMTAAFAARLGERIQRNCPITAIEHDHTGVKVHFTRNGQRESLAADDVVLSISPMLLGAITVTPEWPAAKAYAISHTAMDMYSRVVLQTRTAFWKGDQLPSVNLDSGDPRMPSAWETAAEVPGARRLLIGYGKVVQNPDEAAVAFREFYPGKNQPTIEQSYVHQWWKEEPTCVGCERLPFAFGQLGKMWPHLITPVNRIHFAGAAYDNLGWGMDAATRSANRVAAAIDAA